MRPALRNALTSAIRRALNSRIDFFPKQIDSIIIFGASILNQSFSPTGIVKALEKYESHGVNNLKIFNYAESGTGSISYLERVDTIIAEHGSNALRTMVILHGPGNDILVYPHNAELIASNMREICSQLKAAGFILAISDITKRIEPSEKRSIEYNSQIINPLINEFADIPLQLYKLTDENEGVWHGPDGTHPSQTGIDLTINYLVDVTSPYIIKTEKDLIEPPTETAPFKDVLLQFGRASVMEGGLNLITSVGTIDIFNTDYTKVTNATVTLSGIAPPGDTFNSAGRGNVNDPTHKELDITNHVGLTDSLYIQSGAEYMDIHFEIPNLNVDALIRVQVTASRAANTGQRLGLYSIAGQSEILLDAVSSPAEIIEATCTGRELLDYGIKIRRPDGGNWTYLSLVRVTEILQ
tara:strand:+ start:887 stop:2119 length:1233 start_codon:yes stop_codon:yes gene_type:complete